MSAASVKENQVATKLLENLKSGEALKGVVRSHSTIDSVEIAWVAVRLPLLGERQVCVKGEHGLRIGQKVVLRCVPDSMRPDRFVFQLAEPDRSSLAKDGFLWHRRTEGHFRSAAR